MAEGELCAGVPVPSIILGHQREHRGFSGGDDDAAAEKHSGDHRTAFVVDRIEPAVVLEQSVAVADGERRRVVGVLEFTGEHPEERGAAIDRRYFSVGIGDEENVGDAAVAGDEPVLIFAGSKIAHADGERREPAGRPFCGFAVEEQLGEAADFLFFGAVE